MIGQPKCSICGKFIPFRLMGWVVSWVPFGSTTDIDPPDEEYAHRWCWKHYPERWRELTRYTSWSKPWSLGVRQ